MLKMHVQRVYRDFDTVEVEPKRYVRMERTHVGLTAKVGDSTVTIDTVATTRPTYTAGDIVDVTINDSGIYITT